MPISLATICDDAWYNDKEVGEVLKKSRRSVQRERAKRQLAFTYIGKTPHSQGRAIKEMVAARVLKARRGSR
jgi:hypothetical protein